MKAILIFFTFLFLNEPLKLAAQDFGRQDSFKRMNGLSDEEKVKFINKNYYALYSADFKNADSLAAWASSAAQKNKWRDQEAQAQLNWGLITYLSGKYDLVLPKYFKALAIFDSLNDIRGQAHVNNEMAVFYQKNKNFDEAIKCLDKAEKLATEINDIDDLGTTVSHRGAILMEEGKYKEAKTYVEKGYQIRLKTKDSVGLGYVFLDFAEIAIQEGKLQESLDYIDKSSSIRVKLGDKQGLAINVTNKGETYFNAKQYDKAASCLAEALSKAKAIGYNDLIQHCYNYLSKTYVELHDFKKAYELDVVADAYRDSLFNIERTKVIQELQTKYEAEKKDLQISDLNKDNQLKAASIERNTILIGALLVILVLSGLIFYLWRRRQLHQQEMVMQEQQMRMREAQISAVIDSQEKERTRFASDLHDGIGQLVSALQINVQSIKQHKNEFETRDELFNNSEQLLAEIHQEIRNIAFNLMPPVLVKEGLLPAVNELLRKVNKSGKIKCVLTAFEFEGRFAELAEISLYRIIQELMSNIIKYSSASKVNISFTGFENEVVLTIEDDGLGYDLEKFKISEGNGWRNINSRLNLIKGAIEFDIVKDRKNNTITISIPSASFAKKLADLQLMQNTNQ
jgi:signal transduction histidine kinase